MKSKWLLVLNLLETKSPKEMIDDVYGIMLDSSYPKWLHLGICFIINYNLREDLSFVDRKVMLQLLHDYNNTISHHSYEIYPLYFFTPILYSSSSEDSCVVDRIKFVKSLIEYYYD